MGIVPDKEIIVGEESVEVDGERILVSERLAARVILEKIGD